MNSPLPGPPKDVGSTVVTPDSEPLAKRQRSSSHQDAGGGGVEGGPADGSPIEVVVEEHVEYVDDQTTPGENPSVIINSGGLENVTMLIMIITTTIMMMTILICDQCR